MPCSGIEYRLLHRNVQILRHRIHHQIAAGLGRRRRLLACNLLARLLVYAISHVIRVGVNGVQLNALRMAAMTVRSTYVDSVNRFNPLNTMG